MIELDIQNVNKDIEALKKDMLQRGKQRNPISPYLHYSKSNVLLTSQKSFSKEKSDANDSRIVQRISKKQKQLWTRNDISLKSEEEISLPDSSSNLDSSSMIVIGEKKSQSTITPYLNPNAEMSKDFPNFPKKSETNVEPKF